MSHGYFPVEIVYSVTIFFHIMARLRQIPFEHILLNAVITHVHQATPLSCYIHPLSLIQDNLTHITLHCYIKSILSYSHKKSALSVLNSVDACVVFSEVVWPLGVNMCGTATWCLISLGQSHDLMMSQQQSLSHHLECVVLICSQHGIKHGLATTYLHPAFHPLYGDCCSKHQEILHWCRTLAQLRKSMRKCRSLNKG